MSTLPSKTPNLKLQPVNADRKNWTDLMNNNLAAIDASVGAFFSVNNLQGIWENSHAYTTEQAVIDIESSVVYQCIVDHVSAAIPTTFLEDRTANPSYWIAYSSPARGRGAWESDTFYRANDFVVSGAQYAICLEAHTSSSSFSSDVSLGKWEILLDLSTAPTVLPIPGGAADAGKFVVVTPAGTGYTIVAPADALELLGISSIGQGVFQAISQAEARAAINAQVSGDYQAHSSVLDDLIEQPIGAYGLGSVATRELFRGMDASPSVVIVAGLTDPNDGWGGVFVKNSADTLSADDGALVIVNSLGTRYHRLRAPNYFDAAWYEAFGAAEDSLAQDYGAELQALFTALDNHVTFGGNAVVHLNGAYKTSQMITYAPPASSLVPADGKGGGSLSIKCGMYNTTIIGTFERAAHTDAIIKIGTTSYSCAPFTISEGLYLYCEGTFATRKDPMLMSLIRCAQSYIHNPKFGSCNSIALDQHRCQNMEITGIFSSSGGRSLVYIDSQTDPDSAPGVNTLVRQTGTTLNIVSGPDVFNADMVGQTLTITSLTVGAHRQCRIVGYTSSTSVEVDNSVNDAADMRVWFGSPYVNTNGTTTITIPTPYGTAGGFNSTWVNQPVEIIYIGDGNDSNMDRTYIASITDVDEAVLGDATTISTDYGIASNGTWTRGSKVITGIPDTTGMANGQAVLGIGIPSGAEVDTVDSGTQITMNVAATKAATNGALRVGNIVMAFLSVPCFSVRNQGGATSTSDIRLSGMISNPAGVGLSCQDATTVFGDSLKITALSSNALASNRFTLFWLWGSAWRGFIDGEFQDQPHGPARVVLVHGSSRLKLDTHVRLAPYALASINGAVAVGQNGGFLEWQNIQFSGTETGFEEPEDLFADYFNSSTSPGYTLSGGYSNPEHAIQRVYVSNRVWGTPDGKLRLKGAAHTFLIDPNDGNENDLLTIKNETDSLTVLTVGADGGVKIGIETTVAALPAASASNRGHSMYVTDANSSTFYDVAAGGGSNNVRVTSTGATWRIG